jgi:hypothetical protein
VKEDGFVPSNRARLVCEYSGAALKIG